MSDSRLEKFIYTICSMDVSDLYLGLLKQKYEEIINGGIQ